jgi:hypothetical protein
MALQSRLFRDDPKLAAAAVSNPAHIVPGAAGDHVTRIQHALLVLGDVGIEPDEQEQKRYGPTTAKAVLAFKAKRDIVNRSYQTQADNIVGIMTIAALDKEMVASEAGPRTVRTIGCRVDGGVPLVRRT